jgi:hypothetical protein
VALVGGDADPVTCLWPAYPLDPGMPAGVQATIQSRVTLISAQLLTLISAQLLTLISAQLLTLISAQLKESPQAQELPALGLSMVKPCFSMVSAKSIDAPSR